jgi:hypothetical protein
MSGQQFQKQDREETGNKPWHSFSQCRGLQVEFLKSLPRGALACGTASHTAGSGGAT